MTHRRSCKCSSCRPRERAVSAGTHARCPNGHATVMLASERDLIGACLRAWCTTPGCGTEQLFRREAA